MQVEKRGVSSWYRGRKSARTNKRDPVWDQEGVLSVGWSVEVGAAEVLILELQVWSHR